MLMRDVKWVGSKEEKERERGCLTRYVHITAHSSSHAHFIQSDGAGPDAGPARCFYRSRPSVYFKGHEHFALSIR